MNKAKLSELDNFTGTENYHRHNPIFRNFVVTDGVMFLAKNADCFWLLDEIAAAQHNPRIKNDEMLQGRQFWTLEATPKPPKPEPYAPMTLGAMFASKQGQSKYAAILKCERDTDDVAYTQPIEYTDFPFDAMPQGKVQIWVAPTGTGDGKIISVAYLPSEH